MHDERTGSWADTVSWSNGVTRPRRRWRPGRCRRPGASCTRRGAGGVPGLHSSDAAGLTLSPRIATPPSVSRPRPGSPEGTVPRTRRIRPPRHLPGPTGLRAAGALSLNPAFHAATPARRLKSLWPQSELRCSRLPGSSRRARPPPFLGSETASETKNDNNTKEVSPSGTRRGEPRPSRPRPSGVCVLRDTVSTVAPW